MEMQCLDSLAGQSSKPLKIKCTLKATFIFFSLLFFLPASLQIETKLYIVCMEYVLRVQLLYIIYNAKYLLKNAFALQFC